MRAFTQKIPGLISKVLSFPFDLDLLVKDEPKDYAGRSETPTAAEEPWSDSAQGATAHTLPLSP